MHWSGETIKQRILIPGNRLLFSLYFLLFISLIFPASSYAAQQLSPSAEISILTCGPGKPLYATFGHTAIRVNDPENNIDEVFNYGTFDVNTPNFYLKFLQGKLDYELSVSDFESFLEEYSLDNRWIFTQDLLISSSLKQKIYDSLLVVLQPENRAYRYDFFRNNCSTRVIDLILAFTATPAMIDSLKTPAGTTFRKALDPYIGGREWLRLGIDILLGPFADQKMSKLQSTYLPENLMHVIALTKIAGKPADIISEGYQPPQREEPDLPMILFWVLAMVLIFEALWSKSSQKITDRIDVVLFSIAGIFGLLFMYLWFWSDHVALHLNLNLFWANPLNFILVWAIIRKKNLLVKIYSIIYALLLFFLLINWSRLPQQIPLEMMPIATMLVFRAVNRVFNFRKTDKNLTSNSEAH